MPASPRDSNLVWSNSVGGYTLKNNVCICSALLLVTAPVAVYKQLGEEPDIILPLAIHAMPLCPVTGVRTLNEGTLPCFFVIWQ